MTRKHKTHPIGMLLAAMVIALPFHAQALINPEYVIHEATEGAFPLVSDGTAATVQVSPEDQPGVMRVVQDFCQDIDRVTGITPLLHPSNDPIAADALVIVGTLGNNPLIDRMINDGTLNVDSIRGKWEAFLHQVVDDPVPGIKRALVIVGSDRRGTMYGLYTLSEEMGVSPWYWWADVPVKHQDEVYVLPTRRVDEPTVQYRGIFLNDEAPALTGWVHEKFGNYNHEFYKHVFELILRLRGNFLWPAMWSNAFWDDDPLNGPTASEYGIVMSTSHHEPMNRAHQEWYRYGKGGEWDYSKNPEGLQDFWREGIRKTKDWETITTLAMRGDGDRAMSEDTNVALLEKIVADQRAIISEEMKRPIEEVPQVWALYKEVQSYYEHGMRVPDDVILLWCDDNWGNIRRLPTEEERKRPGGAGVYYHFDYVGGPRSYKWINTVPLPKIWEQMHLAWQYDANRLWVVNVGDLKPMEFPIDFFLTYAWNPERWPHDKLAEYQTQWASRTFPEIHAEEIADLIAGYTRLNGRRKPEQIDPGVFSILNYREDESVLAEWDNLSQRAQELYDSIGPEYQDAFFQLVLYPVCASAVITELSITAARNNLYAVQGRASTNTLFDRAVELFEADREWARRYNEDLAGGKWSHMMDQANLGYTYWQQPQREFMPAVTRVHTPQAAEMAIAIEGDPWSWPTHNINYGKPRIPGLDVYAQGSRWVDVFNRGADPFTFKAETSAPWLNVSPSEGEVTEDTRIEVSVDWSKAPLGASDQFITLAGSDGTKVQVIVPVSNPESPRPESLSGYIESNGTIAIEAARFQRSFVTSDLSWQTIDGLGRTLSGITPFPVTAPAQVPSVDSTRLEYDFHVFKAGKIKIEMHFSPTLDFQPGDGRRYAIAINDELPQIMPLQTMETMQNWEKAVSEGVRKVTTTHEVTQAGPQTLRYWMVDPGVVLQRIVIDTGGLKPSYLGPQASPLFQAKAE